MTDKRTPQPGGQGVNFSLPPELLDAIDRAVMARQGRKAGGEIKFLCVAHDDQHPSARWNRRKAVSHCDACGAGSGAIDLAQRLGIPLPEREKIGLTVADLAAAKGIDIELLRELGVRDDRDFGRPCVIMPYTDINGEVRTERKRLSLTGDQRFRSRKGDKSMPYGLSRLRDHRGQILIVEGETDCWTCWQADIQAFGVPGANTWRADWARYLDGAEKVYVWREPDAGGDSLAAKVVRDLPDVHIIEGTPEAKDPNQLWLTLNRDPEAFKARMAELMAAARPASEVRAEALTTEARECWILARPLLEAPDLMDHVGAAMVASGYAGDVTAPKLAYVALTSRRCPRPLNLAYVAQSAAGKTHAVETALKFMPTTAYHRVGASSARALIYDDEADYEHKTVVVGEADSIPEEGPAASAIRSLAADNQMVYDVVERDEETGRHKTRRIVKPGPTGLITTSTQKLGEQMGTRMLTVTIADTPAQTRSVLRAVAAAVNGEQVEPELTAFIALQRWLELAGDSAVTIPYADVLAEAVPDSLVRIRRDFRQLLTVIEAIALLHRVQRDRDAEGRIIATLADYRLARDLLLEVFSEAVSGGVSRAVRETVQAVAELYAGKPVDVVKLAGKLGLHRTTTWRRCGNAIRLGFLVNEETRKGQPAKLVPGAALPDDRPALPEPETVMAAYHPETTATVQPDADSRIWPASDGPVAQAVAERVAVAQPGNGVQPEMQPLETPIPDTEPGAERPPVARLQTNRGDSRQEVSSDSDGSLVPAVSRATGAVIIARRRWKLLPGDHIIDPPAPSANGEPRCAECGSPAENADGYTGVWWCDICTGGPVWTKPKPLNRRTG